MSERGFKQEPVRMTASILVFLNTANALLDQMSSPDPADCHRSARLRWQAAAGRLNYPVCSHTGSHHAIIFKHRILSLPIADNLLAWRPFLGCTMRAVMPTILGIGTCVSSGQTRRDDIQLVHQQFNPRIKS
jgi:hypothetical protein